MGTMLNGLDQIGISTNDTVLQVEFQGYSFGHWGHLHIYINAFFICHPIWQTFQAILKMADWVDGLSWNLYTFCGSVQYSAEICLFKYADVGCWYSGCDVLIPTQTGSAEPNRFCGYWTLGCHKHRSICAWVLKSVEVFDLMGKMMCLCAVACLPSRPQLTSSSSTPASRRTCWIR